MGAGHHSRDWRGLTSMLSDDISEVRRPRITISFWSAVLIALVMLFIGIVLGWLFL